MPVVATKKPSKSNDNMPELDLPALPLLEAECERQSILALSALRLMSQLEQRCTDLEPSQLKLTPSERQLLASGGIEYSNDFELCRQLRKVRGTRFMLEEFSFEELDASRAALEQAREAVRTTIASMEDLAVDDNSTEPVLARTIAKLQEKLSGLQRFERDAAYQVRKLEEMQAKLENAAPQPLKDLVLLRRQKAEMDPRFQELADCNDRIRDIEQLLETTKSGGALDPKRQATRKALMGYGQQVGLGTRRPSPYEFLEVDENDLREHLNDLRTRELPELKELQERLQSETQAILDDADPMRPIHEWIENEGLITLDQFT